MKPASGSIMSRFLDGVEWLGNRLPDPLLLFLGGAVLVMALSQFGAWAGWSVTPRKLERVVQVDASGAEMRDGSGALVYALGQDGREVTRLVDSGAPIRPTGLLSGDGLYWAISSLVDNFINFPPLGVVLVGMLGIGLAEKTGFIGAGLKAAMLVVPPRALTPAVIFLGVMSSLGTDAGYVVLPPIAAALYKAAGRSPLAGIAAVFAGVAGGFNANLLITSLDPLLAGLTGPAARTIDPTYTVNPACNWYFMIASTFMLVLIGWVVSMMFVERRFANKPGEEGGPAAVTAADLAAKRIEPKERKGLIIGVACILVLSGGLAAMRLIPGAPFDDAVRGPDRAAVTRGDVEAILAGGAAGDARLAAIAEGPLAGRDLASLVAAPGKPGDALRGLRRLPDSVRGPGRGDHFDRWAESIVPMLFILFVVPGFVHGVVVGVIRSGRDLARLMVDVMAYMAPVIVLAFFAAQFIEYFKFSNLDRMLAHSGGQWLYGLGLEKTWLIVAFVLVAAVFNIFIASMSAKYSMFAPIFVPMLMLVGISPELTQTAYRIGDSVTNIITPLNSYMIIILVAMQKHAPRAGMGTLISMMLPYTIFFTIAWLLLLAAWMAVGSPLGPDSPLFYPAG